MWLLSGTRSSQFRAWKFVHALKNHQLIGSMGQVHAAGDDAATEPFFALFQRTCSIENGGASGRNSAS